MFLNSTNSKFRGSGTLLMENVKPFEEKILKDPQVFQESCRIFYNMQNLTEISLVKKSKIK